MSVLARQRRRYDQDPPRRVLARGIVVVGLMGVLLWAAASSYNGVPGRDYRYVDAVVPQVGSLISHDPVRMGGVRVGQVASIHAAPRGEGRLRLQIEPGTSIPADTQVRIRAAGLLGARFVELVPGRDTRQLADGQALHGDAETLTYGVTDALDVLDRDTRSALRPMLGELGRGLEGQGRNINDVLRIGAANVTPDSELFAELRRSSGALERLLPSLRAGLLPLDESRRDLVRLFRAGDVALRPFVQERSATRETLAEAPPSLDAADAALRSGRPLLAAARAVSAEVRRTLPGAPAALRATTALLRESHAPLRKARRLLRAVRPAVPALLKATHALDPLLAPARKLLDDIAATVRVVGPYDCDIRNFGAVFRSATGMGNVGPGGPGGPAMEFRLQAVAPVSTEALGLTDATGLVKREPVPEPCTYLSKPYRIIDKPQTLGRGR